MENTFTCPRCQTSMVLKNVEVTLDGKGKEYQSSTFWCEKEDIWIVQEAPKQM